MADIFKVIFQLDADAANVYKELDNVQAKYKAVNSELRAQDTIMDDLRRKEAELLKAREKASSVSTISRLNKELNSVRKEIEATQKSMQALEGSEKQLEKQSNTLNASIAKAFEVTKIQAFETSVKKLQDEAAKIGDVGVEKTIKKFDLLKANLESLQNQRAAATTQDQFDELSVEIEKTIKDLEVLTKTLENAPKKVQNQFSKLRADLKAAKGELAAALETGDQNAIQEASEKVGKLKDQIDDTNEAAAQFASESKFQQIGNIFGDIGTKIINLDFKGAEDRSKALLKTTKQLTFKEAVTGIKQLGTTFLNLGKSLLMNPLFLIAAVVLAIIANFDKLKHAGGLIGEVFKGIGKAIDVIITAGKDLLDFIGLIDSTKKSLEELVALNEDLIKNYEAYYDRQIALLQSKNKRTIDLENEKNAAIKKVLAKELEDTKKHYAESATSYEDFLEFKRKAMEIGFKLNSMETANNVRNNDIQIKALDKLRTANKELQDEKFKGIEIDIKLKMPEGSANQIEQLFQLRLKQLEKEQSEEKRLASIEFKDYDGGRAAKGLIDKKYSQIRLNLEKEKNKAIVDSDKKFADEALEIEKNKLLSIEQANNLNYNFQVDALGRLVSVAQATAEGELQIYTDFYNKKIQLAYDDIAKRKKLGLDIVQAEKDLAALQLKAAEDTAAASDKLARQKKADRLADIEEAQRHDQALRNIANNSGSQLLDNQIKYEREKLKTIEASGKAEYNEIKKQKNLINELEKQSIKQRKLEYIDYTNTIIQASISATNQVLSTKIAEYDKLAQLQEGRLNDAKNIADKGNAELLQLEQERLDNLNKQREKYVRQQQALAVVELIANTAIAVSKAAAEGGVAAGVTIAAALIALVAGLASAKSIASQAAFYDGGMYDSQGYTGDGNPRDVSKKFAHKPYTSHMQEFIFNHGTTRKYKGIFHGVHQGKIDLNEWQEKVKKYDDIKAFEAMNTGREIMPNNVVNKIEFTEMKNQMNELISAVKNIPGVDFMFDEEGVTKRTTRIKQRADFISKAHTV